MPSSFAPLHGTPITGSVVFAAMAPAKCAAMPASAMIQENPLSRADDANSLASFGHRWADSTRTSVSISYSFRTWIAFSATGRSLVLPMMTATFRMALASLKQQKWALHCPNVQLKCPDGRPLNTCALQSNALCSPVVTHVSVSYKELNLTNLWYHRGPLSSMRQKRESLRPISRFFDDNRHIHKLRLYLLFENVQTRQKSGTAAHASCAAVPAQKFSFPQSSDTSTTRRRPESIEGT